MKRVKLTANFYLDEFIPKEIYDKYGENSRWFIDYWTVQMAQAVRTFYNFPIVINDWWNGGQRNYSGFRPWDCEVGAKQSQHKMKCAIDCHQTIMSPEEWRQKIRKDYDVLKTICTLSCMESDTPTWVHLDRRWTNLPTLLEVPYQR